MNVRGFTLLELLISISLIVIIVVIVTGAMRLGYRSVEVGEKKIDSLNRLRMSLRIIDAQLQSEVPLVHDGENGREFYFRGDRKSLQFSTNYSIWDGRQGYVIAAYRIESDDHGRQVLYVSENVIGLKSKRETKLFDDMDDIYFEYFDRVTTKEDKWTPQWVETTDIPEKVRIQIYQGVTKLSLIIPMRARESLLRTTQ
ncbi:MAG: prepilin-type N-terminal cleavage/methylation domain-containing protein [Proteobacteria bacterium]|nr:prepilin-type N-terminal cleavage/methylation domain-containing protein [Pseudomonadota bacterium]